MRVYHDDARNTVMCYLLRLIFTDFASLLEYIERKAQCGP